jgi:hypothetical protein
MRKGIKKYNLVGYIYTTFNIMADTKKNSQKTEKEELGEIRKAAIREVKRFKKEGKSITTNAVEVVCTEKDIFHTKSRSSLPVFYGFG